jgi:localization factor PodJL
MKFGFPWSVKGIRPEARETAREAARRSGMSLGDWLNAVILQQAAHQGLHARTHGDDDFYGEDLVTVHQRLNDLARRIEQITRTGPAAYAPRRRGRDPEQVSDLIGRLDRRLDQFAGASRPLAPPLAPAMPNVQLPPSLDRAVAEIAARQRALNGEQATALPQPQGPSAAPRAPLPAQDISGLEDQLRRITDQIETLRKPGVEEAINALRAELGEIGHAINEAMPRRAIDAIEKQIQGLTQRIAEGRQAGVDHASLAGIEQGLAEVRDALRGLTPAEQLVGFNEAIDGLAHKMDLIVAQKDPATLQQLESAITTLRSMATHVASNETVSSLAADVQALGEKVDAIARTAGGSDALSNLEHRIAAIADALAERAQNGGTVPPKLEALVQSLSDKIEQIQSSRSDNVAIGHLEDRIVKLVEKLDASESRLGQLEAIERGLGDLLVHIEGIRANRQDSGLRAETSPAVDELKHNIARTQDALEAVHGTLGHVVDRLAMIERDIRGEGRGRIVAEEAAPAPPVGKLAVRAVSDAPAEPPRMPQAAPLQMPAPQPQAATSPPPSQPRRRAASSLPLDPDLPPDQPLEPGSGPPKFSARIAASEAALAGATHASAAASGGKSSFIAAARRAAQTALQQAANEPAARREAEEPDAREHPSLRGKLTKRIKSLFVAAGIIALVAGSIQLAGIHFGGSKTQSAKTGEADVEKTETVAHNAIRAPLSLSPQPVSIAPPLAAPMAPSAIASTPPVNLGAAETNGPALLNPPDLSAPTIVNGRDITGSIPNSAEQPAPRSQFVSPGGEQLPSAIGGPKLRHAAAAGDSAAEYEVAVRFAEGRGVPVNLQEAARWFGRAASTGLAPAQFRYASMLEKGQGVKKDLASARRFYLAAATSGNAKAMHNLAVLYAEGIDGKPDYATAVKWFRKAAQHGITDSQYNLGVLCARGLGTDKSFVESYKWFALAAAKGDPESAKKRNEVAAHLDPQMLAKAEQAVKAFVAEPQPAAAIDVPKPRGGWDSAATPSPKIKAKAHPQPHPNPQPHGPLSLGSFTVGKR